MAAQSLSAHERRILAVLEEELRKESALDYALRTMMVPKERLTARVLLRCGRIPLDWMILLVACGVALAAMALAVHTVVTGAWAGGFWVLTALLVLARACGRRRQDCVPRG